MSNSTAKPEIPIFGKKLDRNGKPSEKNPFCRFITLSYAVLIDYLFFQFHSNINRLDRQYQEYIFVRVFELAKNFVKFFYEESCNTAPSDSIESGYTATVTMMTLDFFMKYGIKVSHCHQSRSVVQCYQAFTSQSGRGILDPFIRTRNIHKSSWICKLY